MYVLWLHVLFFNETHKWWLKFQNTKRKMGDTATAAAAAAAALVSPSTSTAAEMMVVQVGWVEMK